MPQSLHCNIITAACRVRGGVATTCKPNTLWSVVVDAQGTMAPRWHSTIIIVLLLVPSFLTTLYVAGGVQIISKSKLQKCEKNSNSDNLNCTTKIVVNMAVPSGSSGGEASIVAELVEVEENSTTKMQTLRIPPVITVNKSAAYALYELTYIRDVPYKPEEYYVQTRKCEPDASANVVKICERLRDEEGHIIEKTQPICCPCGPQRRMPSSCGNFFDKLTKGKANTAHCVRFPGDRNSGFMYLALGGGPWDLVYEYR